MTVTPVDPLVYRDDALVTLDMAPHTAEATAATGRTALDDALVVLSGHRPRFAVVAPPGQVIELQTAREG